MISIDGRHGEGGGQILRSSLALSLVTGQPFELHHIRGGRAKPGLLRQHLTCVRAAQVVGNAEVEGAQLRSDRLVFEPRTLQAGEHHFAVGSAGSTSLVLQSILPALMLAEGESTVRVEGGTHAMAAPPFHFLARSFVPVLLRMGRSVAVELVRPGFFPAGGGEVELRTTGGAGQPVELRERGPIGRVRVVAWVSGLPRRIAAQEAEVIRAHLDLEHRDVEVQALRDARGPGNAVWIEAETVVNGQPHVAVFTGFGRKGVPAEDVAMQTAQRFEAWRDRSVPVCEYLADQLLLPMALSGGGIFRTGPLSLHTRTNIDTMRRFLPHVDVMVDAADDGTSTVTVGAA